MAAGTSAHVARDKSVSRQPSGSTGGFTGTFLKPVLARARASRQARDEAEDVEAAE